MSKQKRLTKYDTHVEPRLIEIEGWARDGLIDEQITKAICKNGFYFTGKYFFLPK